MICASSKAQRSMIPVALRARPDKRSSSSITNLETFSNMHQIEPLQKVKSQLRNDFHVLSMSKSDSSLSETLSENDKNYHQSDYHGNQLLQKRNLSQFSSKVIQSANYSSTNLRINICRRSLKSNEQSDFEDSVEDSKSEHVDFSKNKDKQTFNEPSNIVRAVKKPSSIKSSSTIDSSRSTNRANSKQSINRSSSLSSGFGSNVDLQLERQLQEKDLQITQLMNTLNEKNSLTQTLHFEMDKKDQRIEGLMNEIKMRKQDMAEMSRKIIAMDHKLKLHQKCQLEFEDSSNNRPFSGLYTSYQSEQTVGNSKWFNIVPMRFKKAQSSAKVPTKSNDECINELKTILKEKEMIITDLRLDSKLASHKLEQMGNILRRREEETLLVKKNNDYLEKAIKSKLLD